MKILQVPSLSERKRYELYNCIERYCLTKDNKIPNAREKMKAELILKGLSPSLITFLDEDIPLPEVDIDISVNDNISVMDFTIEKTPRVIFLIKKGGIVETVKMCLRYASILSRGQQWGIPWPLAEILFRKGIRNEAFASPLNSRVIEMGGRFCSLYSDTDKVFGSLGSFFEINMHEYEGGWSVNPPMIETILNQAASKVIDFLDRTKGKIPVFFSMGAWQDTPAFNKLSHSKWLVQMNFLSPGKYYYQDPNQEVIRANFLSVYFILGGSLTNLEEIERAWLI